MNLNGEFSTKEFQMTEKHLKEYPESLIIRQMQISQGKNWNQAEIWRQEQL